MSNHVTPDITLFDGDDYLFKKYVKNCDIYFEYGVGKSTNYVIENTKAKIVAVDSDKKWIESIDISKRKKDIRLNWIDLGELEDWGRPKTYSHRKNFMDYISVVWQFNNIADVILIDGRFRVACFLFCLNSRFFLLMCSAGRDLLQRLVDWDELNTIAAFFRRRVGRAA